MIKKISLIILTIVCISSINAQLSYFLSNKFWRLKHATIEGRAYNFNEINSNAPTLQFSGGNIRGNGGCNAYHTRFTINGNSLDISQIMSTRMSCNDMYLSETDYFKAMSQSHTLSYEEGTSEFRLQNASGDEMVFFAQFARSGGSYTPPPRREYREETTTSRPARLSRHKAVAEKKLSKKELARQKLLEKKLNSKKGGKLSKKEKRELMALQSKTKKVKAEKIDKKGRGKKGKGDREEKRGGKKGKDKKDKKGKEKLDKKSKKESKKVKTKGKDKKTTSKDKKTKSKDKKKGKK
jgi:heat shock protein HslJ